MAPQTAQAAFSLSSPPAAHTAERRTFPRSGCTQSSLYGLTASDAFTLCPTTSRPVEEVIDGPNNRDPSTLTTILRT